MTPVFFQPESVFRDRANALAALETVRIRRLIPATDIQHVGGTSVIGALTKGDVDLIVTLRPEEFDAGVQVLRGHYAINQPENWTPTFASFKDDTSFELPFGAQVVAEASETYGFVALRDRLNSDPVALASYNAIKLAHQGGDPTKYREAKGACIERLLAGHSYADQTTVRADPRYFAGAGSGTGATETGAAALEPARAFSAA